MKLFAALCFIAFTFFVTGCRKDGSSGDESQLYGTWVMGPNFGDTLQFMRKNNQDIMRICESFNPALPAYTEKEYRFRHGVLQVRSFSPISQEYYSIDSFTWTQPGTEFRILGNQLFLFMSSMTSFTYHKL